jgi:hypothetical protein
MSRINIPFIAASIVIGLSTVSGCATSSTNTKILYDDREYQDVPITAKCASKGRMGEDGPHACNVGTQRIVVGGTVSYKKDGNCYTDVYERNAERTVIHGQVDCDNLRPWMQK